MLKKKFQFIKDNKVVLSTLFISILLIFNKQIFFNDAYLFGHDFELIYYPNYLKWISMLDQFFRHGTFPFYSWENLLGSDFYSDMSFYINWDIFLPVIMLFDNFVNLRTLLMIEDFVCIIIAGISMRLLLKSLNINNRNVLDFLSLIYALSGIVILYIGSPMFLRYYAFFPLLFYSIEYYIDTKKAFRFILIVFILILQCYYFMFPTIIFLPVYSIFTLLRREQSFKIMTHICLKLLYYFIIGFLLSMIFILPTLLTVLTNARVGNIDTDYGVLWPLKVLFGLLFSTITTPNFVPLGANNLFHYGFSGHESWYSIYITIIPTSCVILFLTSKKYCRLKFMYVLMIIALICPFFSSIMHGFSNPSFRWVFIYILFSIIISAIVLNDNHDNRKVFSCGVKYLVALIFLLVFIIIYVCINSNLEQYFSHLIFLSLNIGLSFFILICFKNIDTRGYIISIVALICLCYFCLSSFSKGYDLYENTLNKEHINYLDDTNDDKLFRFRVDKKHLLPSNDSNLNKSVELGYMGVAGYSSVYDSSMLKFLKMNDINWHIIDITNQYSLNLLGVKYYIVNNESELPKINEYKYITNNNHLKVYENLNFKGFARTFSNIKSINEFTELEDFENTLFVDTIAVEESFKNIENEVFNIEIVGANSLVGNIYANDDNILFVPIPNNRGWKIYNNDIMIESVSVNGGLMGIPINEGHNSIRMYFTPVGFKLGTLLTLLGSGLLVIYIIFDYYKK